MVLIENVETTEIVGKARKLAFSRNESAAMLRMMSSPRSVEQDPLIGELIAGRFRIRSRLAAGGMGVVYLAEQVPLGRKVAVKILKSQPDLSMEESFSRRFLLEAAAVANLSHPNTVIVHDYGRDEGLLYFAMEFIDGPTLGKLIRNQRGPLTPLEALHVARQIASSLRDAHDRGLVHRDLKPGNVMIQARGDDPLFAKVLDFGLVKIVAQEEGENLTQSGIMMGSPRYMSPEQVTGGEITHLADIYALGGLLCFMLTGKPPFESTSHFEAMRAHVYSPVPSIAQVAEQAIPADIDRLVQGCLAKDPAERIQTMGELVAEIDRISGISTPHSMSISLDDVTVSDTIEPEPDLEESGGAKRWMVAGVAVVLTAGLGLAAAFAMPGGGTETESVVAIQPGAPTAPGVTPVESGINPPANPTSPNEGSAAGNETSAAEEGGTGAENDSPATEGVAAEREVLIQSTPPATVFLNGSLLGETPFSIRADEELTIELRARGYRTEEVLVDGSESELQIDLRRARRTGGMANSQTAAGGDDSPTGMRAGHLIDPW